MTLKGYFIEAIYPRYTVYRIVIINYIHEVSSYNVAIHFTESIQEWYPDYVDLGGMSNEFFRRSIRENK